MARAFTPKDCHLLMNELFTQATGQKTATIVNTSQFVSVGEKVLATGTENVLNALGIIIGKTLMDIRPYKAKLSSFEAINNDMYTNRLRKISFYTKKSKASGYFNTDTFTNLKTGFTNGQNLDPDGDAQSTKSMWEQDLPMPLELNFGGTSTWQESITVTEDQLKVAFRDEASFGSFISGIMTQKANEIEQRKEQFNRMTLLNFMGGVYDLQGVMKGSAINLTEAFNTLNGTSYTSEALRTTYAEDFYKFFVEVFKNTSRYLTENSTNYHWTVSKTVDGETYEILRHTPTDKQKVIMYEPFMTSSKVNVMPQIFNPNFLDINTQYEGVDYWQSNYQDSDRPKIKVTPSVPNNETGLQTEGSPVNLDYVVGMIYDSDALMVSHQLERALSTPVEARKGFRNLWWTFAKNAINDFTHSAVLFYMQDAVVEEEEKENPVT